MAKFVLSLGLVLLAGLAFAAEDQARLAIIAETSASQMARATAAADENAAAAAKQRLQVRFWSPGLAPQDATAMLSIPETLQLGKDIKLEMFRPDAAVNVKAAFDPDANKDFTVQYIFGSAEAIADGHAESIRWDALSEQQRAVLRNLSWSLNEESYFFKPDWTTAFWPGHEMANLEIAKDASIAGKYKLASYAGDAEIEVPESIAFLPAFELTTAPADTPSLEAPIQISWKAIPRVRGFHAIAYGLRGNDSLVIWDASAIKNDMAVNWNQLTMPQIEEALKTKAIQNEAETSITIPAGIFKDCKNVSLSIIGYGAGIDNAEGQIMHSVQAHTTMRIMLTSPGLEAAAEQEKPAVDVPSDVKDDEIQETEEKPAV